MLTGRIAKQGGRFWSAECEIIGAFTQGLSVADARDMLESLITMTVRDEGHATFEARITGAYLDKEDGSYNVVIESNKPSLLAARVLKHQREIHQLSLADVARRLGASSRSSYANYEQGRSDPSLAKFRELLAAVAPELVMIIQARPRVPAVPNELSPPKKQRPARRAR